MYYYYSPTTAFYINDGYAVIPAGSIEITKEEYVTAFKGQEEGKYISSSSQGRPIVVDVIVPTTEEQLASFSTSLQYLLDNTASQYGYDNIYTAISYADEPAVLKFQDEGKAFRKWRSLLWEQANSIKQDVMNGLREVPSIDNLIQELPKLTITYTEG